MLHSSLRDNIGTILILSNTGLEPPKPCVLGVFHIYEKAADLEKRRQNESFKYCTVCKMGRRKTPVAFTDKGENARKI